MTQHSDESVKSHPKQIQEWSNASPKKTLLTPYYARERSGHESEQWNTDDKVFLSPFAGILGTKRKTSDDGNDMRMSSSIVLFPIETYLEDSVE